MSGTTDLAANDLEDLLEVCVPFGADGPDVFYSIEVPPSHQLTATLVPTDWDPALWFVTDCTDETSCVAGVDSGFFNDPEILAWTNETAAPVTIYVIPDGFNATADGPFELTVECDPVIATQNDSWGEVKSRF